MNFKYAKLNNYVACGTQYSKNWFLDSLCSQILKGVGSRTCPIGKKSKVLNESDIALFCVPNISTVMNSTYLRIKITVLRFHRVMKNNNLV